MQQAKDQVKTVAIDPSKAAAASVGRLLEEAVRLQRVVRTVLDGATGPDAEAALSHLDKAKAALSSARNQLHIAEQRSSSYMEWL